MEEEKEEEEDVDYEMKMEENLEGVRRERRRKKNALRNWKIKGEREEGNNRHKQKKKKERKEKTKKIIELNNNTDKRKKTKTWKKVKKEEEEKEDDEGRKGWTVELYYLILRRFQMSWDSEWVLIAGQPVLCFASRLHGYSSTAAPEFLYESTT